MNADQVKELLSNATPGPWVHLTTEPFTGEIRGTESFTHIGTEVDGNDANAALIAAAPAVAQWGLERDAEVARLREALKWVAHLSAKAVSEDVEGYYTNEMGRTARAALEGTS